MLQRHLGLLKADGQFGPATRARLVAVQRTRHLTVNGFVGIGMWRALGAGTGTYTPPVRGITSALFTSTLSDPPRGRTDSGRTKAVSQRIVHKNQVRRHARD